MFSEAFFSHSVHRWTEIPLQIKTPWTVTPRQRAPGQRPLWTAGWTPSPPPPHRDPPELMSSGRHYSDRYTSYCHQMLCMSKGSKVILTFDGQLLVLRKGN